MLPCMEAPQNERREVRFTVLLTEQERLVLDREAREAGVDCSTYLRLRVFGRATRVLQGPDP